MLWGFVFTFNVIDLEPREFSASEASSLLDFASLVMDQMNLRLTSKMVVASLSKMFDALHSSAELNRILTVCAWTKKIKLDDQWVSFEDFLSQRLGFRVSHGITPEAAAELLARYSSRSGESGQQTPEG